jgi:hypothetical protein
VDKIDNYLFYASQNGLARINLNDNSVYQIGRLQGLNDIGIQCMRANQQTKTVIVCYANSNIDLYQNGVVYNIPDLYNKQISGDKTIYAIYPHEQYAYLACGFGIVIVDLKRKIVIDSWMFQRNNKVYPVKDVVIYEDTVYAATDHGLFKTSKDSNAYIKNFATWTQSEDVHTHNKNLFKQFALLKDHFYVMKTDTQTFKINDSTFDFVEENAVYRKNRGGWEKDTSFSFNGQNIRFIRSAFDHITAGTYDGMKRYHIDPVTNTLSTDNLFLRAYGLLTAICETENKPFGVSSYEGLNYYPGGGEYLWQFIIPGPANGSIAAMNWTQSKMAIVHTPVTTWIPEYDGGRVSLFQNNTWTVVYPPSFCQDIMDVVIAPYDTALVYASSFTGGLLEIRNNTVTVYDNTNAGLDIMGTPSDYTIRTTSPVFDSDNNLWFGNWGSSRPLRVRMSDGTMKAFAIPFGGIDMVEKIFVDSRNYLWISCMKESKLFFFNPNRTPANTADDQWINLVMPNTEADGMFSYVHAIAEDKEGLIWLGTDKGLRVYHSPSRLPQNPTTMPAPVIVNKEGLNEILLSFEVIRSIKVDAGNRKWIGTANGGVFLLSPDAKEEIFHFTDENSPLLSNTVFDIEIDGETGEVFFGTDKGLVSFRYTATDGKEDYEELKIFPNPVREDFNEYISISGLKEKSEVKITDAQGGLVYRTLSNGGTAVWNGRRFSGEKASTGVYFVFVNDETGKERKAGKILFIK